MARAEAAKIEAEATVIGAKLKAEAMKIETDAELERMKQARDAELHYTEEQNRMEIDKNKVNKQIYIRELCRFMFGLLSELIDRMI